MLELIIAASLILLEAPYNSHCWNVETHEQVWFRKGQRSHGDPETRTIYAKDAKTGKDMVLLEKEWICLQITDEELEKAINGEV